MTKFILRQINSFFPFLYPSRHLVSLNYFKGIYIYYKNILEYKKQNSQEFPFRIANMWPFYFDRYEEAGGVPKHYFLQDIWAAKKVKDSNVDNHYDIGSRLDGFIAHLLVFTKVTMLDIRPLDYEVENLKFIKTDAMNMQNIQTESVNSLSSLHAVEHFGLGRYGDPIDVDGYKKAIAEFQRIIQVDGNIYFAVPIGKQRVEFDGHRIFHPKHIVQLYKDCELIEFSYIDDNGKLIENGNIVESETLYYGCGLFHFRKYRIPDKL